MHSSLLSALLLAAASSCSASSPRALVYRGPAACDGCPEAVAHLLRTAPTKFDVSYVGPNEKLKINRQVLSSVDLYAQPGGGGLSKTWPHLRPHYDEIRDFVSGGGLFLGHCLGAYFAGRPGFDFLGPDRNVNEEVTQPGSQVQSRENTIIQVNWHFGAGQLAGKTENNRWLFFQDGAVIAPLRNNVPNATILAHYSKTDDIAALVKDFGKGRIGIVGPHPEANKSWYTPYGIQNPDGIHFKYGWDLIETLWHGPQMKSSMKSSNAPAKQSSGTHTSGQPSQKQQLSRLDIGLTFLLVISFVV